MTVPSSTYRLQLRPEFGFEDAREVVDYLDALGVGAVYVSPVLDATPGRLTATTSPTRASRDRRSVARRPGSALADALRAAGLGLVVDIVPNHMSIEVPSANPFWWDVLEKGRASQFAHWFDIDWSRGASSCPCWDRPTTSTRWRSTATSWSTTTTGSRSRGDRGDRRRRSTTGSTTSWSTGAGATPS